MRMHVVFVALSSSLVAAAALALAGPARAEGPPRPGLGDAVETPSAWVLRVPLTLTLANDAKFAALPAAGLTTPLTRPPLRTRLDDTGGYPDPRQMAIVPFHLERRLAHDFELVGIPLTSRMVAYRPDRAWQALDVQPAPAWQSDLVIRLPRDLYAGAAVEQRTTAPRSVFVVAGPRF
jgi:hypothetical protein